MPHKLKYDWVAIQAYYDEGHSIRETQGKFGFGNTARLKSQKAGRFTARTHQEAMDLKFGGKAKARVVGDFSPTTLKGEMACSKFELRAVELGVVVSRPNFECAYDRVADYGGRLHKVQIKYGGQGDKDRTVADIRRSAGHKGYAVYSDEIDVIVIYSPHHDKVYWLPKEVWKGKTGLTLRHKPTKNRQSKTVCWAEKYEW